MRGERHSIVGMVEVPATLRCTLWRGPSLRRFRHYELGIGADRRAATAIGRAGAAAIHPHVIDLHLHRKNRIVHGSAQVAPDRHIQNQILRVAERPFALVAVLRVQKFKYLNLLDFS